MGGKGSVFFIFAAQKKLNCDFRRIFKIYMIINY
jgi:hypothetical protein